MSRCHRQGLCGLTRNLILGLSLVIPTGVILTSAPATAVSATSIALDDEGGATIDILVMNDGRELKGQILEKTPDAVTFELSVSGITTRVTYRMDEIAKIMEDEPSEEAASDDTPRRRIANDDDEEKEEKTYGVRRRHERRDGVPTFYVIPFHGQTGTDINVEVYSEMIEDIRFHNPDYLIIDVECEDFEDRLYNRIEQTEVSFDGLEQLDMFRRVMDIFHDDLGDIPQVVWVKNSVGFSSVLIMSWKQIFFTSDARYGGAEKANVMFERVRQDANMFGKFREAYMGLARGFAERAERTSFGYLNIIDALIRPEVELSASWKGREVEWRLDSKGQYKIDNSEDTTLNLTSRQAENFGISNGTADSMDDVALLLGIREYDVIDGQAEVIFEDYVNDWRRSFERAEENIKDYQKFLGWAEGEDWVKYYGRAKQELEGVLRAIRAYEAVAIRMQANYGIAELQLEIMIEDMENELAVRRQAERGSRRGGARRGGGGLSPGG